jgi:hypothetical protein
MNREDAKNAKTRPARGQLRADPIGQSPLRAMAAAGLWRVSFAAFASSRLFR